MAHLYITSRQRQRYRLSDQTDLIKLCRVKTKVISFARLPINW